MTNLYSTREQLVLKVVAETMNILEKEYDIDLEPLGAKTADEIGVKIIKEIL